MQQIIIMFFIIACLYWILCLIKYIKNEDVSRYAFKISLLSVIISLLAIIYKFIEDVK